MALGSGTPGSDLSADLGRGHAGLCRDGVRWC